MKILTRQISMVPNKTLNIARLYAAKYLWQSRQDLQAKDTLRRPSSYTVQIDIETGRNINFS